MDSLDMFDPSAKKKKKKKVILEFEIPDKGTSCDGAKVPGGEGGECESGIPCLTAISTVDESVVNGKEDVEVYVFDDLKAKLQETKSSLSSNAEQNKEEEDIPDFGTKKKKKRKVKFLGEEPSVDDGAVKDATLDGIVSVNEEEVFFGESWIGLERDYTYDELLTRVYDTLREKNPEISAGEKKKFVMKPPKVMRVGSKKTSVVNFMEICHKLRRQPKHIQAFFFAELGTTGSIDGNNQLIIKGRFQQKQIECVLRNYIKEYVTCHTCHSYETTLEKDTRIFFLQCHQCGSRCSVTAIKSGFQALTGKRAAARERAA